MSNMKLNIAGVEFKNPVIAASGTFGFGREYAEYINLNNIGGISVKGLTLEPRQGNPSPRIAETPSGILNSVGLQNPGVHAFVRDEISFLRKFDTKIIVNIAGNTIEEYCEMVSILNDADIDMIELNVSCPNVKKGCLAFGSTPEGVAEITKQVRRECKKPLIVKLTPNVTDIVSIAKAAENEGADAVSLINTLLGMVIDIHTRRPILHNNMGGLSGPAVKPVAVRMVYQVAKSVNIPIIGMGGISNHEDVIEFLLAGATAVMVGTTNFVNPTACTDIVENLESYMRDKHINQLSELIGKVVPY